MLERDKKITKRYSSEPVFYFLTILPYDMSFSLNMLIMILVS
jgi:hypothetical protein